MCEVESRSDLLLVPDSDTSGSVASMSGVRFDMVKQAGERFAAGRGSIAYIRGCCGARVFSMFVHLTVLHMNPCIGVCNHACDQASERPCQVLEFAVGL